jgi:folate-binding protein YgfZ
VEVPGALPAWWCDGSAVDLRGDEPPTGVPQGTDAMLEHERIASAWPSFGTDVEPGAIPAETGLVPHAVSFTKGCYPGQELVERMDSRGAGAPHRVVAVRCQVPPSPGDEVVVDGAVRGRWTSVSVLGGECVAFARVARGTEIAGAIVTPSRG